MAGKRFWIANSPYNCIPTVEYQTDAGDGVLEVGMFAKGKGAGSPYASPSATGDHTIATDQPILGLVSKTSTHTSTDDGVVQVYAPLPGIIYRGFATTASNIDTVAKLKLLEGDRVDITVSATTTAGDWSINEDQGDTVAQAFRILDGDADKGTIDFMIRQAGTMYGDDKIA